VRTLRIDGLRIVAFVSVFSLVPARTWQIYWRMGKNAVARKIFSLYLRLVTRRDQTRYPPKDGRIVLIAAALFAAIAFQAPDARSAYRLQRSSSLAGFSMLFGPRPTSTVDWWSRGVVAGKWFHLDPDAGLAESLQLFKLSSQRPDTMLWRLLRPPFANQLSWVSDLYWHVDVNEVPPLDDSQPRVWIGYGKLSELADPFGPGLKPFEPFVGFAQVGLGPLLQAPRPIALPVVARNACPAWRAPRTVTFTRPGGEGDQMALVDCDGFVSSDAVDRLSMLARQPGTPRPSVPLPLSPDANRRIAGEWVEGVRLLHPRLLAAVQRIASEFPGKTIAIYSGYRRDKRPSSPHLRGRAIDMAIAGVANEQLFGVCRTLRDMGCGYYPNQPFVHVDVREPSRGSVAWVDVSEPGHPSVYQSIWPNPNAETPDGD
jgi:hypothetical protein